MAYNLKKHCSTLELDAVLSKLAQEATMPQAAQEILETEPSFEVEKVKKALEQTVQAYILISRFTTPPFGNSEGISACLTKASVGATLSIHNLLEVSRVLANIRNVKRWRDDCSGVSADKIDGYFSALCPNKFLEDKINTCIKSEEEIFDNASSELYSIRRKISANSSKIRDLLDKMIRSKSSKYLQEAIVTQRDGRFVVPVKSEYKGEVSGIVHDTSSSGSTVFIEPMSVVETNNEIRILRVKEQDEIARILSELSALVCDFADSIKYSYNALVKLNIIFAKAKFADKTGAVAPKINENGYVYLKNARHPLIQKKSVVPITVSVGREYKTLVITGPNTGGKTVTLKTVGLLCLMACCGMMIPADEGSEVAVFSRVFADIGDEQSIEQSLSTFSSHIVNISSILKDCDSNSLILFDELCAGTDPVEGAALAKAILIELSAIGTVTVATTHYPELKSYALDTANVQNASCEFDVTTLKPTYRLIIGVPGRSNAFAISKRLGISQSIIDLASEQLSEESTRFERVVESLEKARQEAERDREEAFRLKSEANELKSKAENEANELKLKRDKIMQSTRETANRIVEDARYKSSLILNELEETKKKFNAENSQRALEEARRGYKKGIEELEEFADPVIENTVGEKLTVLPQKGDTVIVSSIGKDASVIDVNSAKNTVYVVSGAMKMWVPLDELRLKISAPKENRKPIRSVTGLASRKDRIVSGEIDLRGMASDEAILELDKYIDNAVLSGMGTVTVIHGKGTGVLRKAVGQYLRSQKYVKSFRLGVFGEGENGVTVVELKE